MRFSSIEIRDIIKSWIAISLMFAIAFRNGSIWTSIPLFLLTAGVGFVVHELCHKFVAQKYKCWAEFRSNDRMLIIGLLVSFLGVIFAAPGGVFIRGGAKHQGKIALAGPLSNVAVAAAFAGLFFTTGGIVQVASKYGWIINSWLAAFNMIPVPPFDGKAIIKWNKVAYGLTLIAAAGLTVAGFIYAPL